LSLRDLDALLADKLIDGKQHRILSAIESGKMFSLHYELQAMLYLGVLAFTTGAGILIYRNAGNLAHLVANLLLGALMAACFAYAARRRARFTLREVPPPTPYYSYVVLLGALLFLIIEGYLENVYGIFGGQWGLAAAIPAVLFFAVAYLFDHRGVLSLGIVTAASAVGLEISASAWYRNNVFREGSLIYPAIVFSIVLTGTAFLLDHRGIKTHFTFSYLIWGGLTLLTALLAALFVFPAKLVWLFVLAAACAASVGYARRTEAYSFLFMGCVAAWIGVSYIVLSRWEPGVYLGLLYFMASSVGFVSLVLYSIRPRPS
jgi:hypothetical protein